MVDADLLEILACPLDKAAVEHREGPGPDGEVGEWIVCTACGRHYPVREDIPVMLVEEAVLPAADGTDGAAATEGGA